MCDHDFQLSAEGEVRCINCFVGDDEMEAQDAPSAEFWATQVSFEE